MKHIKWTEIFQHRFIVLKKLCRAQTSIKLLETQAIEISN